MKKLWKETRPCIDVPPGPSDPELVALLRQGRPAAYEQVMRRYNRLLFRAARAILKVDAEAEDAVQEAWLRAFAALDSFRGDSTLATWLVRIVINQAFQQQRRLRRTVSWDGEAQMEESETSIPPFAASVPRAPELPEQAAERHELQRQLEHAIDRLPAIYRCVFLLRAVQELSVVETADVLEVSPDVVKTRYLRARGLLRFRLDAASSPLLPSMHEFQGSRCDEMVRKVLAGLRAAGLIRDA